MKKQFSTKWIKSKQPRKQRKYRAKAPLHIKRKFLTVNLSKPLRKKHGKRNVKIRKDDKVKVLRGKFKGKQGKVTEIKRLRIGVEGIQIKKKDGSSVNATLQPSNLQIIELHLEDAKRAKKLGTKATPKPEMKEEKKEKKKEEKKEDKSTKPKDTKKEVKKDKEEKKQ